MTLIPRISVDADGLHVDATTYPTAIPATGFPPAAVAPSSPLSASTAGDGTPERRVSERRTSCQDARDEIARIERRQADRRARRLSLEEEERINCAIHDARRPQDDPFYHEEEEL
jgi:hypothetical protein